jgi:hypothetical protein
LGNKRKSVQGNNLKNIELKKKREREEKRDKAVKQFKTKGQQEEEDKKKKKMYRPPSSSSYVPMLPNYAPYTFSPPRSSSITRYDSIDSENRLGLGGIFFLYFYFFFFFYDYFLFFFFFFYLLFCYFFFFFIFFFFFFFFFLFFYLFLFDFSFFFFFLYRHSFPSDIWSLGIILFEVYLDISFLIKKKKKFFFFLIFSAHPTGGAFLVQFPKRADQRHPVAHRLAQAHPAPLPP